ncbi:MAG: hypothetical protein WAS21_26550 [Geminicoccaceae bacterium]
MAARAHIFLTLAVVLGSFIAQPVRAQGEQVDVEIVNRTFQPIDVEIYDQVCRQVIYAGQIIANASVSVAACPNQDGLANLTVADRFGHRQTYSGLADPSTVNVEFN